MATEEESGRGGCLYLMMAAPRYRQAPKLVSALLLQRKPQASSAALLCLIHPLTLDTSPPHPPPYPAGRNFVRAALLGLMATFAGVLLFSAPEFLSQWAKVQMPDILMNAGVQVGGGWWGGGFGAVGFAVCKRYASGMQAVCKQLSTNTTETLFAQVSLKCAGCAFANWIMTSFFY